MSGAPISKHWVGLSPQTIADYDDLLIEILIRLPVKSLLRFKLVSKHWLSLITDPRFCLNKSQILCKDISGLLLHRSSFFADRVYDFVPLDDKQPLTPPPFRTLTFVPDRSGIKILQSCNGFVLGRSFRAQNGNCNYYIFNPTTKQFAALPYPLNRRGSQSVRAVYLAFDPRRSLYYKAICIYFSTVVLDGFEIEIYSSETGLWRPIGDPFSAQVNFDTGVYWNGAINWMSRWGDALYFNVDEARFGRLPMPAVPNDWAGEGRRIRYFGESYDHLHLVEIYDPRTTRFNVYEMDTEYSGWFVKYRVDVDAVMNEFPESICTELDRSSLHCYKFLILDLVRRKDDRESYLVLSIPGKAIRYNFMDKSLKKLYDFDPSNRLGGSPMIGWHDAFHFIESLMPM